MLEVITLFFLIQLESKQYQDRKDAEQILQVLILDQKCRKIILDNHSKSFETKNRCNYIITTIYDYILKDKIKKHYEFNDWTNDPIVMKVSKRLDDIYDYYIYQNESYNATIDYATILVNSGIPLPIVKEIVSHDN